MSHRFDDLNFTAEQREYIEELRKTHREEQEEEESKWINSLVFASIPIAVWYGYKFIEENFWSFILNTGACLVLCYLVLYVCTDVYRHLVKIKDRPKSKVGRILQKLGWGIVCAWVSLSIVSLVQ